MNNALWYTIGIAEISQAEKNPMGQMMVAFAFVYLMGMSVARHEQKIKIARRALPKRMKQMLFPEMMPNQAKGFGVVATMERKVEE